MFENLPMFEIIATITFIFLCWFAWTLVGKAREWEAADLLDGKMLGITDVIIPAPGIGVYTDFMNANTDGVRPDRNLTCVVHGVRFLYKDIDHPSLWHGCNMSTTGILFDNGLLKAASVGKEFQQDYMLKRKRDMMQGGYTFLTVEDLVNAGIFVNKDENELRGDNE